MPESIRQSILSILKPLQTVMLATCHEGKPHVRPMILIYHQEKFFFATGTADAKARQIAQNPNVEMCLYIDEEKGSCYVRASGILEAVVDPEIRSMVHQVAKFIQNYFPLPDDPGFALYRMHWQSVEYMKPGQSQTETIDW
jgi:general stress protein 26